MRSEHSRAEHSRCPVIGSLACSFALVSVPIVRGGQLVLDSLLTGGARATVAITRIQIEQDSGKNLHDLHPTRSYVDLNRAGVGLMEIVSEPDMRSAEQAAAYIRKLTTLLQHLGTCRGHMEDGSLRCDVNVSVRRQGTVPFGERVEVKNLNSLRSLQRAIDYEMQRQVGLCERGEAVARETRGFDAKTGHTVLMRTKEQMLDYRFAPEPDLPPLVLSPQAILDLQRNMPELPETIAERFRTTYGLSTYDIGVLAAETGATNFLDELVYGPGGFQRPQQTQQQPSTTAAAAASAPQQQMKRKPKMCANWLTNELFGRLKRSKDAVGAATVDDGGADELLDGGADASSSSSASFAGAGSRAPTLAASPVSAAVLGQLIDLVEAGSVSGKAAKDVLDVLLQPGETRPPHAIVRDYGWAQSNDAPLLEQMCRAVMQQYPTKVSEVQAGNKRVFGFLSGQVLKLSAENKAQLSPSAVSKRLTELIAESPPPPAPAPAAESTPAAAAPSKPKPQ